MFHRKALIGAFIGAISWVLGYFVTQFLGDGLSSASAYAMLVGWWFTAYTASVFKVPVMASIPLACFYFVLFFLSALSGQTWLYRDATALTLMSGLYVGTIQTVVVVSPILFNSGFVKFARIAENGNKPSSAIDNL